jgi:hypothetical protein
MLKVDSEVQVKVEKNVPTIVSVAVVSEYDTVKTVTVVASCGCTTSKPSFQIEPYQTYINDFKITRVADGDVTVNFVTDGRVYQTIFKIKVN